MIDPRTPDNIAGQAPPPPPARSWSAAGGSSLLAGLARCACTVLALRCRDHSPL